MKKWLYSIAAVALVTVVAFTVLWLRNNRHYDNNDPLQHIPSTAVAVLKVNGAEKYVLAMGAADYHNDLDFVQFDQVLSSVIEKSYSTFSTAIRQEPSLGSRTLYVSLHPSDKAVAERLLISFPLNNYADGADILDALRDSEVVSTSDTTISGDEVVVVADEKSRLYVAPAHGCMFASPDASLLKQVMDADDATLQDDPCFTTLQRTSSPSVPVAAFVNIASLDTIRWGHISNRNLSRYGTWAEMDFDISQKAIATNGFMTSSKYSIISALASHRPSKFKVDNVVPSCAEVFVSYAASQRGLADQAYVKYLDTCGEHDAYKHRRDSVLALAGIDVEEQLSQVFSGDMALFSTSSSLVDTANVCLIVSASNGTIAQGALNSAICALRKIDAAHQIDVLSPVPTLGVPVYEAFTTDDDLFFLNDYLPYIPRRYYIRYENTLMFADEKATIKRALYETLLNRTFANDADFRNFRSNFTDENVFFGYCSSTAMRDVISMNTEADKADFKNITNFYGFGVQVSRLSDLPYITTCGLYEPGRIDLPPTAWQSKIDTTIVGKPYAVINHNTGETEYLVQDATNKIYLINASGLILWNRKMDGPVVGEITQIDYYNNRKLQYLFATPSSVHLIDRNGNNTARFPIQLSSEAVGSVTYIDYGNPKDFRLFVPCSDKRIALFDKNCKPVEGWEMKHTEGYVRHKIDHWVSSNKDYLISTDDYNCYITDRRGNIRIALNQPLAPNKNSHVYLVRANTSDAAFVTSTADGKMASINIASSEITTADVDSIAGTNHFMFKLNAESKFVFVNSSRMVLTDDRGVVENVHPLYLSAVDWAAITDDDKIALWDKSESLGYLYDQTGRIIDGFPIPAKSPFTIVHKDGVRNIVVAGSNGTLNNYVK